MGIQNFYLEIKPRKVGLQATYIFHFTIEKKIEVHQSITLVWPPGTTINPPLPEDPKEKNERLKQIIESMSIGLSPCSSCQGLPIIETDKQGFLKLTFNTHIELNPDIPGYKNIYVTVPDRCGFSNPKTAGTYTYKVATAPEPEYKTTTFDIVNSQTQTPQVTIEPPIYNANAQYKIEFEVGAGGWLGRGTGLIKIKFPEETKFQRPIPEIKPEHISINGKILGKAPNGTKNLINFTTPVEIPDNGKVTVIFDKKAGLINPSKIQQYQLEVATSIDTEWVKSKPYSIQRGVAILEVEPAKVNRIAQYKILFVLDNGKLNKGNGILIRFPKAVILPQKISSNCVLVNEKPVFAANFNSSTNEAVVFPDAEILIGESVEITFTKKCGIKNPKDPCQIKMEFKPQNYDSFEETQAIEIVAGKLEINEIKIEPPNAYALAKYQIKFLLGDNGGLKKEQNIYIIKLAEIIETKVEAKLEKLDNEIAEIIPTEIKIDKSSLIITCKTDIAPATSLILSLDNIANPSSNTYELSIKTDTEPELVSASYTILPPLPKAEINISGGKIGRAGWYTEPPIVGFSCSDPEAKIFIFWDGKENQIIEYSREMPLEAGQYIAKLHYYAENPYGKMPPKMKEFKIDTEKPIVIIDSPKEATSLTNTSNLLVSGRVTAMKTVIYGQDTMTIDKMVQVNGRQISVKETGEFQIELTLKNEKTQIIIEVQDEAGNSLFREFIVFYDPIPPKLIILTPHNNDCFLVPKITIQGTTEPEAQLLINGEIIFVEEDGSFATEILFPNLGKHNIVIEATDRAGNTTKQNIEIHIGYIIVLKVGETKATVNGTETVLDIPPYIKNGRTLVPFRFIGEALKAQISYASDPLSGKVLNVAYYLKNELGIVYIKLVLGSNIAIVNNKKVVLDVPPEIKNGRTFVPIRFVSENLGAQVEWEASTQTITIKYPKI